MAQLPAHVLDALKGNGEDVKVVQELMRHANITTTMNIYTRALTPAKRKAQRKAVDVLFNRTPRQVVVAVRHRCVPILFPRTLHLFPDFPLSN